MKEITHCLGHVSVNTIIYRNSCTCVARHWCLIKSGTAAQTVQQACVHVYMYKYSNSEKYVILVAHSVLVPVSGVMGGVC